MNRIKSNTHFKNCAFLLVFWCLFPIFHLHAQEFRFTNGRKQQTMPFSFVKNLIIIPIYINEKGPFDFILDTGVNPIIITDSTLKESLHVPYPRAIKISGYGNFDEIDAFLGGIGVKVGDAEAESIPAIFLKNDVSALSGYVGKKIYGLIGYNFFNSFVVKVSYSNRTIRFSVPEKKVKLKGEKIPFELVDNKPYINLTVEQEGIGRKTVKALVDCGAGHAISLETLGGKPFPQPKYTIAAHLGNGLTSHVQGRMGRLTQLQIGGFLLKEVLSNYPQYNIDSLNNKGRNANLGAEILSRFNTIFDYQNRCMYLKKNELFGKAFEHDMSGIELYAETGPPSRTVISKIDHESPAELVGLKEGDELISINFKKIDTYTIDQIGEMFKAKNGYGVVVEVWRDKSSLIKLLKLKKRI